MFDFDDNQKEGNPKSTKFSHKTSTSANSSKPKKVRASMKGKKRKQSIGPSKKAKTNNASMNDTTNQDIEEY